MEEPLSNEPFMRTMVPEEISKRKSGYFVPKRILVLGLIILVLLLIVVAVLASFVSSTQGMHVYISICIFC